MAAQVTIGLFATDIDGLESGPLSHLGSFDAGRAFAEAHEVSFDALIVLISLHVVAILYFLLVERNNLMTAMLNGRKRLDEASTDMRTAPVWRVWTGVALATLVVWMIVAA